MFLMIKKHFALRVFTWTVVFVGIMAAGAFLSACGSIESSYQRGLEAYRTGNYESAVTEFQPAAEKGHPEALYKLALCYYNGKGVGMDKDKAFDCLRQSAAKGNVKARFAVVSKDADDNIISRDDVLNQFREMDAEMLELAEADDPEAQIIYAMFCLMQGKRDEAKIWAEKSEVNGGKEMLRIF
jgi:TPR repeat protein